MATAIELPSNAKFLIENSATFSIFDRQANAHRTPTQRVTALALRPLMLWLAAGKSSHWFDYHNLPEAQNYEGLQLPKGNSFDVYHPNPLVKQLRFVHMSLGGWKDTALIGPDPQKADFDKLSQTGWLFGYRARGDNQEIVDAKYSKLVNPRYTSIMILRGPRNFDAIGLDPQTLEEVPLAGIISPQRGTRIQ